MSRWVLLWTAVLLFLCKHSVFIATGGFFLELLMSRQLEGNMYTPTYGVTLVILHMPNLMMHVSTFLYWIMLQGYGALKNLKLQTPQNTEQRYDNFRGS